MRAKHCGAAVLLRGEKSLPRSSSRGGAKGRLEERPSFDGAVAPTKACRNPGKETMSFNPRSDVVLEVLNAADPARASLAAGRLAALGAGAPSGGFAADLDRAASAIKAVPTPAQGLADARSRLQAVTDSPEAASRVKVEFEAMMLNSFVGEMLPKDASAVFGEGAAGDIWRSMLSEQVSRQLAKSGALGLSRRLFATHELEPHAQPERLSGAAEMSANILSAPSAAEVVNGAVLLAGRKRG